MKNIKIEAEKTFSIGFVLKSFPPVFDGGGTISAKLLANELNKRGVKVEVLSFDADKLLNKDKDKNNKFKIRRINLLRFLPVNLRRLKILKNLYQAYQIIKFSKNKDIIHCYGHSLFLSTAIAKVFTKKVTILTLNFYTFNYPNVIRPIDNTNIFYVIYRIFIDYIYKIIINTFYNKIVVISKNLRTLYVHLGIAKDKLIYIPNMTDTSLLTVGINKKRNRRHKILLYCGSLIKIKGVEYLIRAIQKVRYLAVKLIIVGDGDQKQYLKNLVVKLDLQDKIEFLGFIPNNKLSTIYQRADIFIQPSIWPEAFGRTVIEAMSFGLPVIASNIGGLSEIIDNRKLICQPRDEKDLAKKIKFLLINENYRKKIGELNYRNVLIKYSPKNIVNKYLNVYKKLI